MVIWLEEGSSRSDPMAKYRTTEKVGTVRTSKGTSAVYRDKKTGELKVPEGAKELVSFRYKGKKYSTKEYGMLPSGRPYKKSDTSKKKEQVEYYAEVRGKQVKVSKGVYEKLQKAKQEPKQDKQMTDYEAQQKARQRLSKDRKKGSITDSIFKLGTKTTQERVTDIRQKPEPKDRSVRRKVQTLPMGAYLTKKAEIERGYTPSEKVRLGVDPINLRDIRYQKRRYFESQGGYFITEKEKKRRELETIEEIKRGESRDIAFVERKLAKTRGASPYKMYKRMVLPKRSLGRKAEQLKQEIQMGYYDEGLSWRVLGKKAQLFGVSAVKGGFDIISAPIETGAAILTFGWLGAAGGTSQLAAGVKTGVSSAGRTAIVTSALSDTEFPEASFGYTAGAVATFYGIQKGVSQIRYQAAKPRVGKTEQVTKIETRAGKEVAVTKAKKTVLVRGGKVEARTETIRGVEPLPGEKVYTVTGKGIKTTELEFFERKGGLLRGKYKSVAKGKIETLLKGTAKSPTKDITHSLELGQSKYFKEGRLVKEFETFQVGTVTRRDGRLELLSVGGKTKRGKISQKFIRTGQYGEAKLLARYPSEALVDIGGGIKAGVPTTAEVYTTSATSLKDIRTVVVKPKAAGVGEFPTFEVVKPEVMPKGKKGQLGVSKPRVSRAISEAKKITRPKGKIFVESDTIIKEALKPERLKTTPMIITASRAAQRQRARIMPETLLKQVQRPRTESIELLKPSIELLKQSIEPAIKPQIKPSVRTAQQTLPKQEVIPKQKITPQPQPAPTGLISTPVITGEPFVPGVPPIKIMGGLPFGRKKKGKRKKQPKKYLPSLVAIGQEIKAPKPKKLTGIEVRPIL